MGGEFPGLEKHFKNGNIVVLKTEIHNGKTISPSDIPELDDTLVWHDQRMTFREFAALGLEEQIVVTKELNGVWLAREKAVFQRDGLEAMMALADSFRITGNGQNGPGRLSDRWYAMSKEERSVKASKIMRERTAAKMAQQPSNSPV